MIITAAVAESPSAPFTFDELHLDSPRAGEVLVELAGTGICHTDLVARDQVYPMPLPAVLGHEGAGIVRELGDDVTTLAVGDHVVLTFDWCGACRGCVRGLTARCANILPRNFGGARPDGSTPLRRADDIGGDVHGWFFGQSSFATHAITSVRNTVLVRRDVPLHLLGPLGCGIQTGAGTVLNSLRPEPGCRRRLPTPRPHSRPRRPLSPGPVPTRPDDHHVPVGRHQHRHRGIPSPTHSQSGPHLQHVSPLRDPVDDRASARD